MSQISPPIRVLAVCAIAFLAAWMLFLRPKAEPAIPAEPVATTEPASAAGQAVQQADAATAAANANASAVSGEGAASAPATTGGAAKPGAAAGAEPEVDAAALRALPADVARAVRRDKVLVLLFWNRGAADDRAVKRALGGVDRWGGRVFVEHADVRRISRYAPITRGANVEQSPTVVVVDRKLRAEALVGFVDTPTIDQAVTDAIRNSGSVNTDPYLRRVNDLCRVDAFVPQPTNLSRAQVSRYFDRTTRIGRRLDRRFMALEAPRKWRGFKAAAHRDHLAVLALAREGERAILRRDAAALASVLRREKAIVKRYDARMDEQHVLACGTSA